MICLRRNFFRGMNSIASSLLAVDEKITESYKEYCEKTTAVSQRPCLIAVSKTKSYDQVKQAYEHGQRDFGENYVRELVEKALQFKNAGYVDIRWHFIGALQRNKVNNLLGAENIFCIQTVNNEKLADALHKTWSKNGADTKLNVFVQINSSGEESKSGCVPGDCVHLVKHILTSCPSLKFVGLMTIGAFNHDYSEGPNPDFQCLLDCRERVCEKCSLLKENVCLSMGMSNDYQHAILHGATHVRVGSHIFGTREGRKSDALGS